MPLCEGVEEWSLVASDSALTCHLRFFSRGTFGGCCTTITAPHGRRTTRAATQRYAGTWNLERCLTFSTTIGTLLAGGYFISTPLVILVAFEYDGEGLQVMNNHLRIIVFSKHLKQIQDNPLIMPSEKKKVNPAFPERIFGFVISLHKWCFCCVFFRGMDHSPHPGCESSFTTRMTMLTCLGDQGIRHLTCQAATGILGRR